MISVLLVLSTTFGALLGSTFGRSHDAGASTMLTQLSEFSVLEDTYNTIRENYVLEDEISDQDLMYGAASGMVESLGDEGHSTFLTPQEAAEFEQSSRGELIGIGIQVDLTGPLPVVIAPIDESPAFEAGIKPGDVIIAVNDTQVADVGPDEAVDLIRGEEGTEVSLTLRHADMTEVYEVTITRAKITVNPVSYAMLPNNVLWLRLSQFSKGAKEGVQDALQYGKDHGMTSVILDLRNNPGGLVSEAQGVASQFLPKGAILYQEQLADGTVTKVPIDSEGGLWLSGDLVVVINEGSASASEIVSSAIRDNDRGTLYGETTFGTGTVLWPFDFSDGSMVLLGTRLWLTADGAQIWKHGVDPDVEIMLEPGVSPRLPFEYKDNTVSKEDLSAFDDTQLLKAYDAVTGTGAQ
jgi:carboxyl-terminal processing protease